MPTYLILTDSGIVTKPVQAADAQALAAILAAEAPNGRAAAIPLTTLADIVNGAAPAAFVTGQTNYAALLAKADAAIQTNVDALALPDPTATNTTFLNSPTLVAGASAAQVQAYVRLMDAQVRALTSQNNALVAQLRAATRQSTTVIRLLAGRVEATTGT